MNRNPLDAYDNMPDAMLKYISNYGFHFSKEACEYAVNKMYRKKDANGEKEKIQLTPKSEIDAMLKKYGVTLNNDILYDAVFVYHMAKADYMKSVPDEAHLAWYIKETIDDVDASPETTFRRWLATMIGNGEPISWGDLV